MELIAALTAVVAAIVAVLIALAVAIKGAIAAAVMASAGEAAVSSGRLGSTGAFFTAACFSVCRVASRSWPGIDLSRLPVVRDGAIEVRLELSSEARLTAFRPTPGRDLAAAPSAFPAATAVARAFVDVPLALAFPTSPALAFLAAIGPITFPVEFRVLFPVEEPATVLPEPFVAATFSRGGAVSVPRFLAAMVLSGPVFFDDGALDLTTSDLLVWELAVSKPRFCDAPDPAAFRLPVVTALEGTLFLSIAFAPPSMPRFAS
jgi:hypothetical protein